MALLLTRLFHMQGGPALNQFGSMAQKGRPVKAKPAGVRRGIATGVGLSAASLLAAQSADAAEVAQIAAGDNRLGVLLFVSLQASLAWFGVRESSSFQG